MTAIAFHFGAPDKLAYVCRLLRKAVASGAKLMVLTPGPLLARLDADLWALSATEFVPHCLENAEKLVKNRSPVVLVSDLPQALAQSQVLLNLSATVPPQFEVFERVIEVVGNDEEDRNQARIRWRTYAERGYPIQRHDLRLRSDAT